MTNPIFDDAALVLIDKMLTDLAAQRPNDWGEMSVLGNLTRMLLRTAVSARAKLAEADKVIDEARSVAGIGYDQTEKLSDLVAAYDASKGEP